MIWVAVPISDNKVSLAWADGSDNETAFQVIISKRAAVERTVIVPEDQTTYIASGLDAETNYGFQIVAENEAGTSGESNSASVTTLPIAAPSGLSISAVSPTEIDLFWDHYPDSEDDIEIEWSTDGSTFTPLATIVAGMDSYQASTLTPCTHYWFRVAAHAINGKSAYSSTANTWTYVSQPVGVEAWPDVYDTQHYPNLMTSLVWVDVLGESGYKINWSPTGENWSEIGETESDDTYWSDHANHHGYFRVDAFSSSGVTLGAVVKGIMPPAAPTITGATPTENGVRISWTDNANDEIGYHVFVDAYPWAPPPTVGSVVLPPNSTGYEATGLEPGREVKFYVAAFNERGDSELSNPIQAAGPWMRRGLPTNASIPEVNCGDTWLNVQDQPISLNQALTDDNQSTGYGAEIKLTFAGGVLRNGPGNDLVIYTPLPHWPPYPNEYQHPYFQTKLNESDEWRALPYPTSPWEPQMYDVGTDSVYHYVPFSSGSWWYPQPCTAMDHRSEQLAPWALLIDLSALGVAEGATVNQIIFNRMYLLGADAIDDMRLAVSSDHRALLTNNDQEEDPDGDRLDYDDDTALIPAENSTPVDDELAKVTLDMGATDGFARHDGTLTLVLSDSTSARLFKNDGTELTQRELNLANPTGYLAGLMDGTVDVWVEGLKADPAFTLTTSYSSPSGAKEKEAQVAIPIAEFNFVDTDGDPVSIVRRIPKEQLLDKEAGDPNPLDLQGAAFKLQLRGVNDYVVSVRFLFANITDANSSTNDCFGLRDWLTWNGSSEESAQPIVLYSTPEDESSCNSLSLEKLQLQSLDTNAIALVVGVDLEEFRRKLKTADVQTVEWETYDPSKDSEEQFEPLPAGAKPNRSIGPSSRDQKIYPERLDWNETDALAEMRRMVFAKATLQRVPNQPLAGQTVYFAVYDVDDPSWSSFDDPNDITVGNKAYGIGNDNRRPGHFEKDQDHLGDGVFGVQGDAVKYLQATTDENGVARVVFEVTPQPGNNFKVFATTQRRPLWEMVQADVDGVDRQGREKHGDPPQKWAVPAGIAKSATLTVWRTLHVESEAMKGPPDGQKFDANDKPPLGLQRDAGVLHLPFLDIGLFKGSFAGAYVDVVELPNALNSHRYIKWVYNLGDRFDHSEPIRLTDEIRDIPNKDDFWNVQVISAYEPGINEDGDHPGAEEIGGYKVAGRAFVFGEVLRQWAALPHAVELERLTRRAVLHESLHLFNMPHGPALNHPEWDAGPLLPNTNIFGKDEENIADHWHWWRIRGTLKPN